MKRKKITLLLLPLLFSICSFEIFGQSISGNVNAYFASKKNVGYANVNIYKGDKLVANVLTDRDGNFNVKLDTGVYKCEINYAGFKTITKEIKVTKDEKSDFSLSKDDKSRFSAEATLGYAADSIRSFGGGFGSYLKSTSSKGLTAGYAWGKPSIKDSASVGKLTAGEINDFSKWNLWTDLTKGELKANQSFYNFSPTNRYTVQLKDQNGLPLANAKVELLNGLKVVFTGRSDNTGKAELWERLLYDTLSLSSATSITIHYNDESKTINKIKKFENGINSVVIDTKCEQSANVDIAIVVDATGSMQDEIDYLKFDMNSVIHKAKQFSNTLNLRFANVFYRDHGDVYLTQSQNFTSVLSESVAFTNEHNAGGGGDYEEAVEIALDTAINKLSWSKDTRTKILFLVLDAPPHDTPVIQAKMRELCLQAAEKGIRIVPITGSGTNKNAEYLMRCLALATNGTYVFLTDESGVGGSHIKPSTDNYQVEILNDLLVRVIKSFTYMPDCQQKLADLGVNLPDSQVVILNNADTAKVDSVNTTNTRPLNTRDSLDIQWKFYPNPTTGLVNIVANRKIEELYISDLGGKVLQIIKNIDPEKVVTADLGEYATGIYLIRYPLGKQWISGKIVLVRQ